MLKRRARYRDGFAVAADTHSPLDPAKKHAETRCGVFNAIQVIAGW